MNASYKPGGKYYDPQLPEDYYHIGLVAQVNPVQIINATPPKVRIDTDVSRWQYAGWLTDVAYEEDVPEEKTGTATVFARQGGTVNLRSSPSLQAIVRIRVPLGEKVEVLEETNEEWARVQYGRYTGYMMREFLAPD